MSDAAWRERLAANVAAVRARIAAACERAARRVADVRLVAVTKYAPEEFAAALPGLGVPDLGENQVQQLAGRAARLAAGAGAAGARWHMLGHLQRNKVRLLLNCCRMLHSLDSLRLLAALEQRADELDAEVEALVEVNVAGEATKTGVRAEEVAPLVRAARAGRRVRVRGLMTLAPYSEDPELARPHFAGLRALGAELRARDVLAEDAGELSMGMSQDFEVAIEEGATLVRIGSALFEGLPTRDPRGD